MKTMFIYEDTLKRKYTVSHYDWEGRLEVEKSIKDGKNNGFVKAYHKNGVVASKAKYKDDKIHGTLTEYNESGKAVWRENMLTV